MSCGTGWGQLPMMRADKAVCLILVPPAYTSQTCFICSAIDLKSRDAFRCVACGHVDHADTNASRNIRRQGLVRLRGRSVHVGDSDDP